MCLCPLTELLFLGSYGCLYQTSAANLASSGGFPVPAVGMLGR